MDIVGGATIRLDYRFVGNEDAKPLFRFAGKGAVLSVYTYPTHLPPKTVYAVYITPYVERAYKHTRGTRAPPRAA